MRRSTKPRCAGACRPKANCRPARPGSQRLREILRQARPIANAVHAARQGALVRLPFELALGDVAPRRRARRRRRCARDPHACRQGERAQSRCAGISTRSCSPRSAIRGRCLRSRISSRRRRPARTRRSTRATQRALRCAGSSASCSEGLAKPLPFRPGRRMGVARAFEGDAARRGRGGGEAMVEPSRRRRHAMPRRCLRCAARCRSSTLGDACLSRVGARYFAALRDARVPERAA